MATCGIAEDTHEKLVSGLNDKLKAFAAGEPKTYNTAGVTAFIHVAKPAGFMMRNRRVIRAAGGSALAVLGAATLLRRRGSFP